jgi:hypothetical protein
MATGVARNMTEAVGTVEVPGSVSNMLPSVPGGQYRKQLPPLDLDTQCRAQALCGALALASESQQLSTLGRFLIVMRRC